MLQNKTQQKKMELNFLEIKEHYLRVGHCSLYNLVSLQYTISGYLILLMDIFDTKIQVRLYCGKSNLSGVRLVTTT